jgi:hydrogenase expression/formation protein HypE
MPAEPAGAPIAKLFGSISMKGERVLLAHGSGGRLTRDLIEKIIVPSFDNPELSRLGDSSALSEAGNRMVMTTDSYVVTPLFFPGGDIGKLSVCGTVNDLATAGAKPVALSVGFIIEEGFSFEILEKILLSMKGTADDVPVPLITGDTKVVEKGRGDGIYISTTGVGTVPEGIELAPERIEPGDAVLINGPVGSHEASIICARNDFTLGSDIESDCAPLYSLMKSVIESVPEVKCARDPTRGGVVSVLAELVDGSGYGITLDEEKIPVMEPVRSICEILGMDPLMMANEGKMIIIVPGDKSHACLEAMRKVPGFEESCLIGNVHDGKSRLTLNTPYGTKRVLTMPMGSQLPRIC